MDRPCFLWDRDIEPALFARIVNDPSDPRHDAMLSLLLREAKPSQVWEWTTPEHVSASLPGLMLGRKRAFWEWLFSAWRGMGLVA